MQPSRSSFKQIVGATILLLTAGILFFPAYLFWNASIQRSSLVLPECGTAPSSEGDDQTGRPIGADALKGRIWIAEFIRVEDREEGELFSGKFAELDQNFQRNDGLALVSFAIGESSVDQLKSYAQRHEASGQWHLIRISETGASTILRDWSSATADCRDDLPIEKVFVLVDRRGVIRSVYDGTAPETVQKILVDVGSLLRDRPK